MDASERTWLESSDTTPRRCSPAAGILALGVAGGAFAGILLVTPLMLAEQRQTLEAAWDEDVAAWERHADAAYERGRADGIEFAGLARECAR